MNKPKIIKINHGIKKIKLHNPVIYNKFKTATNPNIVQEAYPSRNQIALMIKLAKTDTQYTI